MALKTAEERIDGMEKTIRIYRLLVIVLFLFILAIERARVSTWIDVVESWIGRF